MQSSLDSEIEQKAKKFKLDSKYGSNQNLKSLMTMKIQVDSLSKNNQRPLKDVAVLYRRFIYIAEEQIIPDLHPLQFQNQDIAKKLAFLQKQVTDAQEKYRKVLDSLKSQGNSSSIPGLSNPVSNISTFSVPSTTGIAYPTIAATAQKSVPSNSATTGYPSFNIGSSNLDAVSTGSSGGYPTLQGGNTMANQNAAYPSMNQGGSYPQMTQFNQVSSGTNMQNSGGYPGLTSNSNYGQPNPQQTQFQGGYPAFNQTNLQQSNAAQFNNQGSMAYPSFSNNDTAQQQQQQTSQQQPVQVSKAPQKIQNSTGLKTVLCPFEIVESFLKVSNSMTSKKLETCAILAGEERDGQLLITTLIIPQQEGHQDHCFMTDEIELFETQIRESVMTIGWIHTHPQFDLFLSSVDLHNQLGYQQQLSEAIAIVYSPKKDVPHPGYETFRVKNHLCGEILGCAERGFHKHTDKNGTPAYEVCKHVQYIQGKQNGISVKVIDHRK